MIRRVILFAAALLAQPLAAQTVTGPSVAAQIATARAQMQAHVDAEIASAIASVQPQPGPKGEKGDKGDTGAAGPAGTPGAAGTNGTNGTNGTSITGPAGVSPVLSVGTVTTLAPGAPATAALRGTAAAPILDLRLPAGQAGTPGATGAQGAAGVGAILLANATLTETATVAIVVGPRTLTAAVTGLAIGDRILLTPSAALPAGYILGDAYCVSAGTLTVDLYGPALAVAATRTFAVKVTVFR